MKNLDLVEAILAITEHLENEDARDATPAANGGREAILPDQIFF